MRELERESTDNRSDLRVSPVAGETRDIPALAIIGAGRVGSAVQRAALAAGVDARLAGRNDALEACAEADAALLCVPDSAISEACEAISPAAHLRYVGHTSGATGIATLSKLSPAAAFGLHPLQTIPDGEADLAGAPCAVSGLSPDALAFAARLAERVGMRPFELSEDDRATYHAAASIASNFLVALEESAARLLERTGVEDGRELLAPLVLRSAANWAERGVAALTGPTARGDGATVERHLEAIEAEMPELLELYRALEERTRTLVASEQGATA